MNSRLFTIALTHISNTVGDFSGNAVKIAELMRQTAAAQSSFVLFQEGALCGYSSEENVTWPDYQTNQLPHLKELIKLSGLFNHTKTVFVVGGTFQYDGRALNVAYVIACGKLWGIVPKRNLPEYGIFFDTRVFSPNHGCVLVDIPDLNQSQVPLGDILFKVAGASFTVSICEDIWAPDIIAEHASWGSEFEFNISASPFRTGIAATRREMLATRASDVQMVLAYTSQVGAQGGIVFDGDGYIFLAGNPILQSIRWQEGFEAATINLTSLRSRRATNTTWRQRLEQTTPQSQPFVVKLDSLGFSVLAHQPTPSTPHTFIPPIDPAVAEPDHFYQDIVEALIMGVGEYIEKTGAFDRVGINSSGGADSALVAIIAALYAKRRFAHIPSTQRDAAVADFVHTFSWPTLYNSAQTRSIARNLAGELGISIHEYNIEDELAQHIANLEALHPPSWQIPAMTLQNLQSEIRATRLSVWCGAHRAAMLNTSNMSEKAVGYGTKRGDMQGDLAVISNLPKTIVYELLHYFNRQYGWQFLNELLATKASAELAADQQDEVDLMPFDILDTLIFLHVGDRLGPIEVYESLRQTFSDTDLEQIYPEYTPGMLKVWVKKYFTLFYRNIHKWVTTPEGIHIGAIDLDRERATHLPTVSSLNWLRLDELDDLPD